MEDKSRRERRGGKRGRVESVVEEERKSIAFQGVSVAERE